MSDTPLPNDTFVLLPGSSRPPLLPKGWTAAQEPGPLCLTGPEGDIRLICVAAPIAAGLSETALLAWRTIDAGFALPIRQEVEIAFVWRRLGQSVPDRLQPARGGRPIGDRLRANPGS